MNNQKGFIQIPFLIAIIIGVVLIGGASYMASKKLSVQNSSSANQVLQSGENQTVTVTDNTIKASVPDNTTFCNGIYYTQCPSDTKFICPKTGEAYCETQSKNKSTSVSADTLICNGKEWLKCQAGYNFYCPAQGDAQCVPQPSVSANNQQTNTSISNNNTQTNQAVVQVEKLLQEEITKQNSWYEEYLKKQAEIDVMLKPIHEEENRITDQYTAECLQFVTGQKASECDQLTLRLNSLEAEASRISGIYPERKTLPKVPSPGYESWRIDKGMDGLSGTIWSPNSTTRYRWSCINPYSCTLYNY